MLSAIGSALVAGGTAIPIMATKHIQVLRAFYLEGAVKSVGTVIEVDAKFASELVHANKAKIVDAPKPVEKPAAETSEPAPVRRRSSKDAG